MESRKRRDGITMFEVVLAVAMIAILGSVAFLGIVGRRGKVEVDTTAQQMASLLREAQSRSIAQSSSTSWGVYFENSTTTAPFFALFFTSYATGTRAGVYRLPGVVQYATSTIPSGSSLEITFSQITGTPSASTSITIFSAGNVALSSTISVASSGAVSH